MPDGVAPAGRLGGDAIRVAAHDDRERARPERRRERVRDVGDVASELVELRGARDVHDDGMVGRPALDREEALQRVRVRGVGAEPVHGLGRERDEPAGAQHLDRAA